jgi:hypothetical protein
MIILSGRPWSPVEALTTLTQILCDASSAHNGILGHPYGLVVGARSRPAHSCVAGEIYVHAGVKQTAVQYVTTSPKASKPIVLLSGDK